MDYTEIARLAKLGRRAEQRGKAVKGCFWALINKIIMDLIGGWLTMLAIGVAHAEWIPTLPTLGYWWTVLLVTLTRGLFTGHSLTNVKKGTT